MKFAALACAFLLIAHAHAGDSGWSQLSVAGVEVHHAALPGSRLATLSNVLTAAVADLESRSELEICTAPQLFIHPDLESFRAATLLPWFQLAAADRGRCRIDMQRLPVVEQHGGLDKSLRHELFHLAQPAGWERWRAEGEAQRFAGEQPRTPVLDGLSPRHLDLLLANPPDQVSLERAMATALLWVMQGR